jgi:hypothetical protein
MVAWYRLRFQTSKDEIPNVPIPVDFPSSQVSTIKGPIVSTGRAMFLLLLEFKKESFGSHIDSVGHEIPPVPGTAR